MTSLMNIIPYLLKKREKPSRSSARREVGRIPGQHRTQPEWMKRALHPFNPDKEGSTVRTASEEMEGTEVLFPTLRQEEDLSLRDAGLLDAVQNNDYLEFDSSDEATDYSKALSDTIDNSRKAYPGMSERSTEFVREYRKKMSQEGRKSTEPWFMKEWGKTSPEQRKKILQLYVRIPYGI
jgi:hypothetical protein